MEKQARPTRPLLGAHMSIAGGVGEALKRAAQVGCDCVQIFTKSARQWANKPYSKEEIATFKENLAQTGLRNVVAHDSYLVNLGAPDEALRVKSVQAFIDELERCETLCISVLIAHPGAHCGRGEEAGIATIARSLNEAHKACPGYKVKVALEITAGQGTNLGHNFSQIGHTFDAVTENDRLRLCFDTEHAFAAGYDLRTEEGYQRTFAELDEEVGLERIAAFHLNDSKKPFHSRVDRHEHIGRGYLGVKAFQRLLNDERFFGLPMCLETPKGRDLKEDVENLTTLRGLFA